MACSQLQKVLFCVLVLCETAAQTATSNSTDFPTTTNPGYSQTTSNVVSKTILYSLGSTKPIVSETTRGVTEAMETTTNEDSTTSEDATTTSIPYRGYSSTHSVPRTVSVTEGGNNVSITLTKTLTSTKRVNTSFVTTRIPKSPTTTEAKKSKAVELEFVGSASDWNQPRLQLCLGCVSIKHIFPLPCYNVTDIQMTSNNSLKNNYRWKATHLHQGCAMVEFQWQAQWYLKGNAWGYEKNGKIVHGWKTEMTKEKLPMKHTIDLQEHKRCPAAFLVVTTEWEKPETTNVTCGHVGNTTESAVTSSAHNPAGLPTGTRPSVSINNKPTNYVPTVNLPNEGFGQGPIIAIVVCSVAVIVVVFAVTICGVRRFNTKRRRFQRDMNYDDLDATSIAFESVPHYRRPKSLSESKSHLYSPLSDEDDEQVAYTNMYNTGEVEDVPHRSGGGVQSVYEDYRLKSFPSSSSHHPLTPDP